MLSRDVLLTGRETAPAPLLSLRAGPLTLLFDPELAMVRRVRLGECEIVRGIYAAVRDRNWGTVRPVVRDLAVREDGRAFSLTFRVECREREIDFAWDGALEGREDGTLTFSLDGCARSAFLHNRIGFCFLHPEEGCAGEPCVVKRADGSRMEGRFPSEIAPRQPFKDMRAIRWQAAPGVEAEARFEGDLFEMEDQRNWTDASFKTYCTPLGLPYPVEIQAGDMVRQKVTLSLRGSLPAVDAPAQSPHACRITLLQDEARPLPRLGLGCASHGGILSPREIERLRALRPAHLRVDLRLAEPGWRDSLRRAATEAAALGAELECALHLSDAAQAELAALAREAAGLPARVFRWLVFKDGEKSTVARWLRMAADVLGRGALIGAGTDAYFAELNRGRPSPEDCGCIAFSINPQVHATDDLSVMENATAQASAVRSARAFAAGRAVAVSPVTLKMRFNPDATGPVAEPTPGELPAAVDPRQMALFGAAWTVASLQALAGSGADSVTYYETTGWRGVMENEGGSPLPERFPSLPGAVFPLYHVLVDAGEFAGGCVYRAEISDGLRAAALTIGNERPRCTLIANLTAEPQEVEVVAPVAQARVLDETTALTAMTDPEIYRRAPGTPVETADGMARVRLLPYAVARLDWEESI